MNEPIIFRLRKELDADIKEAVKDMDKKTVSSLSRDGLRLMLGIRTTKSTVVIERTLVVPAPLQDSMSKPNVSPPTVYIPKRR